MAPVDEKNEVRTDTKMKYILNKVSEVGYLLFVISIFTLCTQPVLAHEKLPVPDRMRIDGNVLYFDTDDFVGIEGEKSSIEFSDENLFGDFIMHYPEIDTVVVGGSGGYGYPADGIARKILEFGLNTEVHNRCASACATIFLAGAKRELRKGARLCFHRSTVTAKDYQKIYTDVKDEEGWSSVFQLAERAYDRGQMNAREHIEFIVSRNIDVSFALKTLYFGGNDIWCPSREELISARVIAG